MLYKNNIKGSKKIIGIITFGFLLAGFLMRPTAFGQRYTIAAMVITSVSLMIYLFFKKDALIPRNKQIYRHMIFLTSFITIYLIYEITISIYFFKSNLEFAGKELITTLVIVPAYSIFLIDRSKNRLFFSLFAILISALGYSAIVTFLVSRLTGIDALHFFSVDVKGYELSADAVVATGAVYFPFTMLYSQFTSGDIDLLRVSGFFREAGIYQAVCCYCLAYEFFTRRSWVIMVGLLAGVVAAFSTAGILIMLVTIGLVFLFYGKRSKINIVICIVLVAIAYPVAFYTPYIGLEAKGVTHSTSISDRSIAISEGFKEFYNNPWGNGLFSSEKESSGINLVASIGAIGFIGFLCQFVIISGWRFGFNDASKKRMIACFPLLITALFSQPIAAAPLVYILTMVSFD